MHRENHNVEKISKYIFVLQEYLQQLYLCKDIDGQVVDLVISCFALLVFPGFPLFISCVCVTEYMQERANWGPWETQAC